MRQITTFILVFGFNSLPAQHFYNRDPSTRNQYVYSETDVLEAGGFCYRIETESGQAGYTDQLAPILSDHHVLFTINKLSWSSFSGESW
jgi:hypothetical protein